MGPNVWWAMARQHQRLLGNSQPRQMSSASQNSPYEPIFLQFCAAIMERYCLKAKISLFQRVVGAFYRMTGIWLSETHKRMRFTKRSANFLCVPVSYSRKAPFVIEEINIYTPIFNLRFLVIAAMMLAFVYPVLAENGKVSKTHIAVYEFRVRGDLEISDAGAIIAEWMIAALAATDRFTLIEHVLLLNLLEEKDTVSPDPGYETKMASDAGNLYGVEAVVSGSVFQWENTVSIIARLIDARTGAIRDMAEISNGSGKNIRDGIYQLARQLADLDPGVELRDVPAQAAIANIGMQLNVHPTRVTTGEEIEITAEVRPSCTPLFINLSNSRKVTPIPLQYFREVDLDNGWKRYETSAASKSEHKIVVLEQDERGENKLGFICEPSEAGFADNESKGNLLRNLVDKLFDGQLDGTLFFSSNESISYKFVHYMID